MQKLVFISFNNRFRQPMINGAKTCTSRPRQMANVGDCFQTFGEYFIITEVNQMTLDFAANGLWKEEGTKSPEDFISIWKVIHPFRGFDPNWIVYVHWFKLVK